jgi:hypothetical protein
MAEAGDVAAGALGRSGWESNTGRRDRLGVTTRSGAARCRPRLPGALATGGFSAGVPSSHPMVTVKGKPNATMPEKTYWEKARTQ